VCGTALESTEADEQLSEVLRLLEPIFKASNNNFFFASSNGTTLNLNRVIGRGIDTKFFADFRKYYHKLDPYYKIWASKSSPTAMITDHALNDSSLSEYYNDFLKPQSIQYQMSVYLRSQQRLLGVLSLFRPSNANEFSPIDQAKAELLAPYLAGALEKALISEKRADQDAIIDSIISHLPYKGVMVLDGSLELIYADKNATRIMSHLNQSKKGRKEARQPLPKEIYLPCKDLINFSTPDEDSESAHQQFEWISLQDNKKLSIQLRRITHRTKDPLLLLCFDPKEKEINLLEKLKQCGLSHRQAEVVFLLNQGLTNKEIANKLFISYYTVENHLRAIYQKMGVNNRTQLSYRLQKISLT
jgi:DNA-binding CsgD family transcriptional regulator